MSSSVTVSFNPSISSSLKVERDNVPLFSGATLADGQEAHTVGRILGQTLAAFQPLCESLKTQSNIWQNFLAGLASQLNTSTLIKFMRNLMPKPTGPTENQGPASVLANASEAKLTGLKLLIAEASRVGLRAKLIEPRTAGPYQGPPPKRPLTAVEKNPPFPLQDFKPDPKDTQKTADTTSTHMHMHPDKFTSLIIRLARQYQATPNNPLPLYMVHDDAVLDPTVMGIFGTKVSNTIHKAYFTGERFESGQEFDYLNLINQALAAADLQPGSVQVLLANSDVARAMAVFGESESQITNGQNIAIWRNGNNPKVIIGKNWNINSKTFQDGLEVIDLKTVKISSDFTKSLDESCRLVLEDVKPAENLAGLLNSDYLVMLINNIVTKLSKELGPMAGAPTMTKALIQFSGLTHSIDDIKKSTLLKPEENIKDIARFKSLYQSKDELAEIIFKFLNKYINQVSSQVRLPTDYRNLIDLDDNFALALTPEQQADALRTKILGDTDPKADFNGAKYLALLHQRSLGKLQA